MNRSALYQTLTLSPKHLCAAFLLLVAIPAVFFAANKLNLHALEDRTRHTTDATSQHVGERIGVINTLLASMVGLQNAYPDLDSEKLLRFSNTILEDANYIRNLGRFERLPHDKRDAFESLMSHNGYSDFSIGQIKENGRFAVRSDHDVYFPVSIAGPLHATVPGLIGSDLNAIPEFNRTIKHIDSSGDSTTIIPLPDTWPLKGDLLAIRTTSLQNESETNVGGFWLTLDMERLFGGLSEIAEYFDVTITIVNAGKHLPVFSAQSLESSSLFLGRLFPEHSVEQHQTITPDMTLVITLKHSVGLTPETLLFAFGASLLIILLSCTYTSHVLRRRQSEMKHNENMQVLFKEREKAEKTLNSVQDAIITLDPDLCIAQINPAAVVQFNTRASAIVGQPLQTLTQFHKACNTSTLLNVEVELAALAHNSKKEIDVIPAGHLDEDFVLRMSLSSSRNYDGVITGHVIVLRDISHERRLTRKLAYQANYDALTGCTNRYFFEQSLERLVEEIPTSGLKHTLCYMDLDQFKIINDTCGHRAGDQLLIELTKNMQMMIRDEDILSRLGGDEFGLILVGVDKDTATEIADRIYDFFQNFTYAHQEKTFSVTASIGIVHIDSLFANSKDIMASADIACYEAKDSGRNGMSVYSKSDTSMAERSEELNWLPKLQKALQNNEFRLHVQAVASLNAEQGNEPVTHFEFLLRLADPDGSEVTPWQFIQAAERYDLMRDIDRWVISNALQSVAEHSSSPGSRHSFSINLSGQSAADPTLKSFIQNQFHVHQVDPSRIWFELTETAAISHFSIAVDLIKNIRTTGAKVALDDFGSGLSSFGYLKNLPVDIIKIDGQFIKEIVNNPIDREMVRAIHRVGESMNIETVAEFVENQAIVDVLKEIGVNYAQGYHIGRPAPVAQVMALLNEKTKAA
ncbi:MAG: EAL domain-containing protein [Granulosicoccus sp.]